MIRDQVLMLDLGDLPGAARPVRLVRVEIKVVEKVALQALQAHPGVPAQLPVAAKEEQKAAKVVEQALQAPVARAAA